MDGKKTGYQLSSSVNGEILEIVITGKVTTNIVKNIDEEMVTLFKTTETRVLLIDFRAVSERLGITYKTSAEDHGCKAVGESVRFFCS